jgi:hypothetical protein
MKNIILKLLSPYLSCLNLNSLRNTSPTSSPTIRIEGEIIPIELFTSPLTISTQPLTSVTSIEAVNDLLLINKPNVFNNMLNNFINFHGNNSDKVKELIIPENNLVDRDHNIHVITGSNPSLRFLKNLRNKESLTELNDNHSLIVNYPCSDSSSITVPTPTGVNLDITSLSDIIAYSVSVFP